MGAQCRSKRGPHAARTAREVVGLVLLPRGQCGPSEWASYAWLQHTSTRRASFSRLPDHSQGLRQLQPYYPLLRACQQHLAAGSGTAQAPYQALEATALPVRALSRHGLAGRAPQFAFRHLQWVPFARPARPAA
ncbi:MAG: hypothetical protein ACRYFX_00335 [Janthinobacterium lividum]